MKVSVWKIVEPGNGENTLNNPYADNFSTFISFFFVL
jgi:hypothetical protein